MLNYLARLPVGVFYGQWLWSLTLPEEFLMCCLQAEKHGLWMLLSIRLPSRIQFAVWKFSQVSTSRTIR